MMKKEKTALVCGAGSASEHILNEILKDQNNYEYRVIGFLDANQNKHCKKINGCPIIGDNY